MSGPQEIISFRDSGSLMMLTYTATRAGSLAALLFCHTVILPLSHYGLSAWRTVYLPVCLTDFLTSCGHSEQLLF